MIGTPSRFVMREERILSVLNWSSSGKQQGLKRGALPKRSIGDYCPYLLACVCLLSVSHSKTKDCLGLICVHPFVGAGDRCSCSDLRGR